MAEPANSGLSGIEHRPDHHLLDESQRDVRDSNRFIGKRIQIRIDALVVFAKVLRPCLRGSQLREEGSGGDSQDFHPRSGFVYPVWR